MEAETVENKGNKEIATQDRDMYTMMEIDTKKLGRVSRGINQKSWLLYPDDSFRSKWDLVITL